MNNIVNLIPYVYIPDIIYFPPKKKKEIKKKPVMIFELDRTQYKIMEVIK